MNVVALAARNVLRNKFRTTLTVVGVAVAVVTFVLLRTVLWAWTMGAEVAAKDRVATRHKVTFVTPLPRRYIDIIHNVPGVTEVTFANWFGAKDPKHENEFFATMAVDTNTFFKVYDEMAVPKAQLDQWKAEPTGAIVGDALAKKLGWKVGDRITLTGTIYPGDWQFKIVGIYTATRRSVDRSQLVFHWKYLNESIPERARDMIGWAISRVNNPAQVATIATSIDKTFEEQEVQTLSMSERALNASFLASFSAILKAMDIVSMVILLIMALILGNTIAMGVRERTHEYGVLRAIGFLPRHLIVFVLGESITIGALGGALGLALAYPLVEKGIGRWLEENMGSFFPYFRVSAGTAGTALAFSLVVGAIAAAVPAYNASKLNVVGALRRIG